jgi:hypothetical protein
LVFWGGGGRSAAGTAGHDGMSRTLRRVTSVWPWSDEGWVEVSKSPERSCCGDAICAALADGVLCGSCAKCGAYVVRKNPKTGAIEVPAREKASAKAEGAAEKRTGP